MKPYYVVLRVLDEKGNVLKEFLYPTETQQLAEFVWETTKRRMEGYH